jgi:hypothetical protein
MLDIALFACMYGACWIMGMDLGEAALMQALSAMGSYAMFAAAAAVGLFAADQIVGTALSMGGSVATHRPHAGLKLAFGWVRDRDAQAAVAIAAAACLAVAAVVSLATMRADRRRRRVPNMVSAAFTLVMMVGAVAFGGGHVLFAA